jgi:hypothetical protein
MNKIMTFEEFKENIVNMSKDLIVEQGGLGPTLMAFLISIDNTVDEKELAVIPFPSEMMNSDEQKGEFIKKCFPALRKVFDEKNKKVIYLCFCCEAWVRKANKNTIPKDWKDLPKSEALVLSFEHAEGGEMESYTIIKDGMMVDKNGDLRDVITLERDEDGCGKTKRGDNTVETSGKFGNLFVKYFE